MSNRDINDPTNKAAEAGRNAADEATRVARVITEEATNAGEQAVRASADAARQSAETVQDAVRTGLNTATQTFQQVTEQFTRAFGFAQPQSQELARKSSQNLEAVTQATAVLAQGAQEISREWLGSAQERLQKNIDGLNALARCRSVQDFVAVQTDLVRDNLQQVIDTSRRLSEVSVRVAEDATRTIQDRRTNLTTVPARRAA